MDDRRIGLIARVDAAYLHREEGRGEAADDMLASHEPLAVRLALMSVPYHQPADLTQGMLAEAHARLGQWQLQVAQWTQLPSKPVPARIAEAVQAAFGDLDSLAALQLLHGLAIDDAVPAGTQV